MNTHSWSDGQQMGSLVRLQHTCRLDDSFAMLTKVRDVVTAYRSVDDVTWTQVGSTSIALGADIRIGLFSTSHNGSRLNESKFDNVKVTKY